MHVETVKTVVIVLPNQQLLGILSSLKTCHQKLSNRLRYLIPTKLIRLSAPKTAATS